MTTEQELADLRRRRGNGTLPVEAPRPRGESAPDMLQVVRKKDGTGYVRRPPSTIENPSPAQLERRIKFGLAAKATAGISDAMVRAARISAELRGRRSELTAPELLPGWAVDLIARGYDPEFVREAAKAWAGR